MHAAVSRKNAIPRRRGQTQRRKADDGRTGRSEGGTPGNVDPVEMGLISTFCREWEPRHQIGGMVLVYVGKEKERKMTCREARLRSEEEGV